MSPLAHLLMDAGLKTTPARTEVYAVLEEAARLGLHLSTEDIFRRLMDRGSERGLATVHRVLGQFAHAGLVDQHVFQGSRRVFELAQASQHDHMVDVESGGIVEFCDPVLEARYPELAAQRGFEVVQHRLTLFVRRAGPLFRRGPEA